MKRIRQRLLSLVLAASIACSWCVPVSAVETHDHDGHDHPLAAEHAEVCEVADVHVSKEAVAESCTKDGKTEEVKCLGCNTVLQEQIKAKKTGHNYQWTNSEFAHWQECANCGAIKSEAVHKFSTKDCAEAAVCTEKNCGYEKAEGEHIWGKAKVTVKVTCVTDGEKTYACTTKGCGATKTEVVEAHGEAVVDEDGEGYPATCDKDGLTDRLVCSECGKVVQKQTKIKKGHTWTAEKVDEVTHTLICSVCGEDGGEEDHEYDVPCDEPGACLLCGHEKQSSPHQVAKWKVTKKVTCIEAGEQTGTCKLCGETVVEAIKPHGTPIVEEGTPATCTEAGTTDKITCSYCDKVLQKSTTQKALGHDFVNPVDGVNGHAYACSRCDALSAEEAHEYTVKDCNLPDTCTVCGHEKVAGEHLWVAGKVTKKSTCAVNGQQTYKCSLCGEEESRELDLLPHTEKVLKAKAVTCDKDGLTEGIQCSKCKTILVEQKVIPAQGHDEEITKEGYPATCTENGKSDQIVCKICKKTIQKQTSIPKLGHDFTEVKSDEFDHWYICTREDCGMESEYEAHDFGDVACDAAAACVICGYERAEGGEHNWGKEKVTKKATCTAEGEKIVTCDDCGFVETQITDKLPHTIKILKGKAATCEKDGLTEGQQCSKCKTILKEQTVIKATGHVEKIVSQRVEPTCTTDGKDAKIICEVCNKTIQKDTKLKKLGHEYQLTFDPIHHWEECTRCGEAKAKAEHKVSNDGMFCSVCECEIEPAAWYEVGKDGHLYLATNIPYPDYEESYGTRVELYCGNQFLTADHNFSVPQDDYIRYDLTYLFVWGYGEEVDITRVDLIPMADDEYLPGVTLEEDLTVRMDEENVQIIKNVTVTEISEDETRYDVVLENELMPGAPYLLWFESEDGDNRGYWLWDKDKDGVLSCTTEDPIRDRGTFYVGTGHAELDPDGSAKMFYTPKEAGYFFDGKDGHYDVTDVRFEDMGWDGPALFWEQPEGTEDRWLGYLLEFYNETEDNWAAGRQTSTDRASGEECWINQIPDLAAGHYTKVRIRTLDYSTRKTIGQAEFDIDLTVELEADDAPMVLLVEEPDRVNGDGKQGYSVWANGLDEERHYGLTFREDGIKWSVSDTLDTGHAGYGGSWRYWFPDDPAELEVQLQYVDDCEIEWNWDEETEEETQSVYVDMVRAGGWTKARAVVTLDEFDRVSEYLKDGLLNYLIPEDLEANLTRLDAAKLMASLYDYPLVDGSKVKYNDCKNLTALEKSIIATAEAYGWMSPLSSKEWGIDEELTKIQVGAMIHRYLGGTFGEDWQIETIKGMMKYGIMQDERDWEKSVPMERVLEYLVDAKNAQWRVHEDLRMEAEENGLTNWIGWIDPSDMDEPINRLQLAMILVSMGDYNLWGGEELELEDCWDLGNMERDVIATAIRQGLLKADGNKFAPYAKITRGELAYVLANIVGEIEVKYSKTFADVAKKHTFYNQITSLYNLGVVTGAGSYFWPDEPATFVDVFQWAINVKTLNSVTNIRFEERYGMPVLLWDAPKNVNTADVRYKVCLNGKVVTTTGNTRYYGIACLEPGVYDDVTIKTVVNDAVVSSVTDPNMELMVNDWGHSQGETWFEVTNGEANLLTAYPGGSSFSVVVMEDDFNGTYFVESRKIDNGDGTYGVWFPETVAEWIEDGKGIYFYREYRDLWIEDNGKFCEINVQDQDWTPCVEEIEEDYSVTNLRFEEFNGMPVLAWDAPENADPDDLHYGVYLNGERVSGTGMTRYVGTSYLEPGTYKGVTVETELRGRVVASVTVEDMKLTVTKGKAGTADTYFELRDDGRYDFFVENNMGGEAFSVCIYENEDMGSYGVDSMEIMGDNRHGTGIDSYMSRWIAAGEAIYYYREYSNVKYGSNGKTCSFTARDQDWRSCNVEVEEDDTSSECGPDARYTLDDGLLTISGSGPIYDWDSEDIVSWYEQRESIHTVIIEDGITGIGYYAFAGCVNLTNVTIPEGVTYINWEAFRDCTSLTEIALPKSLTSISSYAFSGCELSDVYYAGNEADWQKLCTWIGDGNDALFDAELHFGGEEPDTSDKTAKGVTMKQAGMYLNVVIDTPENTEGVGGYGVILYDSADRANRWIHRSCNVESHDAWIRVDSFNLDFNYDMISVETLDAAGNVIAVWDAPLNVSMKEESLEYAVEYALGATAATIVASKPVTGFMGHMVATSSSGANEKEVEMAYLEVDGQTEWNVWLDDDPAAYDLMNNSSKVYLKAEGWHPTIWQDGNGIWNVDFTVLHGDYECVEFVEIEAVPAVGDIWFQMRGKNGLDMYWSPSEGMSNLRYVAELSSDGGQTWYKVADTNQTYTFIDHEIELPAGLYNKVRVTASDRNNTMAPGVYEMHCNLVITDDLQPAIPMTALATGAFRDYGYDNVDYEYIISVAGLEKNTQYILGHRQEYRSGSGSFYTDWEGNAAESEYLETLDGTEFLVWKCSGVSGNGTSATLARTIYGDWAEPVELTLTENPDLAMNIEFTDDMSLYLYPNDPEGKFVDYTVTVSADGGQTWKELGQLYDGGSNFNAGFLSSQLLEDDQDSVTYNKLKVMASSDAYTMANPEYCIWDCNITITRSDLTNLKPTFVYDGKRWTDVTVENIPDGAKGGMFYCSEDPDRGWSGSGVNVGDGVVTARMNGNLESDGYYYRLTLHGDIVADGLNLSATYFASDWELCVSSPEEEPEEYTAWYEVNRYGSVLVCTNVPFEEADSHQTRVELTDIWGNRTHQTNRAESGDGVWANLSGIVADSSEGTVYDQLTLTYLADGVEIATVSIDDILTIGPDAGEALKIASFDAQPSTDRENYVDYTITLENGVERYATYRLTYVSDKGERRISYLQVEGNTLTCSRSADTFPGSGTFYVVKCTGTVNADGSAVLTRTPQTAGYYYDPNGEAVDPNACPPVDGIYFDLRQNVGLRLWLVPGAGAENLSLRYKVHFSADGRNWESTGGSISDHDPYRFLEQTIVLPAGTYNKVRVLTSDNEEVLERGEYVGDCSLTIDEERVDIQPEITLIPMGGNEYAISFSGLPANEHYVLGYWVDGKSEPKTVGATTDWNGCGSQTRTLDDPEHTKFLLWTYDDAQAAGTYGYISRTVYGDWAYLVEEDYAVTNASETEGSSVVEPSEICLPE